MVIKHIKKRDGRIADFDKEKITTAIFKAAQAVGGSDKKRAVELTGKVEETLEKGGYGVVLTPDVETVQDFVEKTLIEHGHAKTAKAYILYRNERAKIREEKARAEKEAKGLEIKERVEQIAEDPMEKMFVHKSKLAKLIPKEHLENYKSLLLMLRQMQRERILPTHQENAYLGDNVLAKDIYNRKYFVKDMNGDNVETRPEDVFARLAAFLGAVEETPEKRKEAAITFYNHLYQGHFLPGGRVIAGAGDMYRLKTLGNCFVSAIEGDNLEAIYKTAYECAKTYSYGGGIGVDISCLRPKNAALHNASNFSTGSVSFTELYSLTTGLIGQSGRRGALMITLDVKHPDALDFIKIKQNPNWVTRQIVDQCNWSGLFDKHQLNEIERQVRENTQVRFANISLKVCDEFMSAVEEQIQYSPDTVLVYKRLKEDMPEKTKQGEINYSIGIPSKDLKNYELVFSTKDISDLNVFLKDYGKSVIEEDLKNIKNRNIFGDYIVKSSDGQDIAIHYAGDFVSYFNSEQTGEIKILIKARDLWNQFVASNYKTAEPGLIFWSSMSKYSPTNYIGRPIISTNPCLTGDSLILTEKGEMPIKEIAEKHPEGGIGIAVDCRIQNRDLFLRGLSYVTNFKAFKTGTKETIKLITKEGRILKCTPDHRILTAEGWKEAGKLTGEDEILVNSEEGIDRLDKTESNGLEDVYDITEPETHSFIANGIVVHNCGEIPLQDGGACNLGSLNLSRFVKNGYTESAEIDWELLRSTTHNFTRLLDNTITWNTYLNPLEKQRVATAETRRLGLGVMGIADMFNQLGIEYDSDDGIALIEKVIKFIANESYRASAVLAKEKGPATLWNYQDYSKGPFFREIVSEDVKDLVKENGLRNLAILTIAPTGTLSNVVLGFVNKGKHYVGVSSGVEPVFALYYRRRSETLNKEESSKFYTVFHPTVQGYVDMMGLRESLNNIEDQEEMRNVLPAHFFRTAHFIDPMKRVQIQGVCQKYIDHSISSTVNLPESIKPDMVSQIYFEAWKKGLKGITIYRDGSRYPILSVATQQSKFQKVKTKTFKVVTNSGELLLKGDEVFTMDDGSLSTAFHSIEQGHDVEITDMDALNASSLEGLPSIQDQDNSAVCKIEIKDGKVIKTCDS